MGNQTHPSPTFPQYPGGAYAITPSDTANIPLPNGHSCVVYVGTGGNIQVTTSNGDTATFTNLNSGSILPVQVTKVWATSTTALGLIGIY